MKYKAEMIALAVSVACAVPLSSMAQPKTTTTVQVAPGSAAVTERTKTSAIIVSIDAATRTVGLKSTAGKVFEIVAGPEIKNFDKLKVGDKVHAEYVQAVTLELKKAGTGTSERKDEQAIARAPEGSTPAGAMGHQVTLLADVVGVDAKKHLVTLRGPKGNLVDLNVSDPAQLKNIKKGDHVEVVYAEAIGLMVEEMPKAPAK